jgi:hypothetical protein
VCVANYQFWQNATQKCSLRFARTAVESAAMSLLFGLIAQLLVNLARLARPGGLRAVAAESLAVKHQLLIMKRAGRRAPNLNSWGRLALGGSSHCDTNPFEGSIINTFGFRF